MNAKWYLGALFIILTVLGITTGQVSVPNQEIVVQFNEDTVTPDETQNAIAIVKKQLRSIGVNSIQVGEEENGRLIIAYYSDIDVAVIKRLFSETKKLELGYTSHKQEKETPEFPSNSELQSYKLNVIEIQNSPDAELDLNGYMLEITSGIKKYSIPDVNFSSDEIDIGVRNSIEKVAYEVHRNIALVIDNSSHNIPEVRAGPVADGNS